jgi:hypothetical protein
VLGQIAAYLIPLIAVAAVAVGLFASSTYDEVRLQNSRCKAGQTRDKRNGYCCLLQGATVFLDSPKYAEDTVKLIPAEDLQRE